MFNYAKYFQLIISKVTCSFKVPRWVINLSSLIIIAIIIAIS